MPIRLLWLIVLLMISTCVWGRERLTLTCIADTWVEAPPFEAKPGSNSPALDNHGADPELVINGRNNFVLLQFEFSTAKGMTIERATLRVHAKDDEVPLVMVGLSTISGSGPWSEGERRVDAATPGSANYYFARARRQPWAYQGSDVTDVTFGLGGSLYAYVKPSASSDGWYEIDVPVPLVNAMAIGDQFGLMLTDEKGQTRARHVLSSREGPFPPVLVVEGTRSDHTTPGRVRSHKSGRVIESSLAEARALGRTTLRLGSVILHFGGAGDDAGRGIATRYEARYGLTPISQSNFESARPVPRWMMDPLAPKTSPLATANSLRDEVTAVVEQLKPGGIYYFAARAIDKAGNSGPVTSLGRYRAYSRTFPVLPERAAGRPLTGSAQSANSKGSVRVWAVPELLKIHPQTGALLEQTEYPEHRDRNAVWEAAAHTVKLTGSRNEFVAFQLAIESVTPLRAVEVTVSKQLFTECKLPPIFSTTGAVQLHREWFVPDDKINGEQRPWYSDALVPLNGTFELPAIDNAVPGQVVQPIFVDIIYPTRCGAWNA